MFPHNLEPVAKLKNFKGYYNRGAAEDVPLDYLQTCNNCVFPGTDIALRPSLQQIFTADNPVNCFIIYSTDVKAVTITSQKYPMLYLDNANKLWDASTHPHTLLVTFGSTTDSLTAIEAFGKIYLAPKVQGYAVASEFTYYWDGTNFAKLAGIGPASSPTLAQVNAGIVDAGVHGVAVSFLYRTGYLSPPCTITNITSTGVKDIELSAIPTGGAGVVGRVLLMTLANQTTLYFVPGGTINDNSTTTATINIHDSALLSSADYLNNLRTNVPSCSSIRFYRGRLIFIGTSDFPFTVRTSDIGIYDSVNDVTNLINIPRDNKLNSPTTGMVLMNTLYIMKPFGTYSFQDTGDVPSTWPLTIVDPALGAFDAGVTTFSSGLSGQDVLDVSFVVHPRGLLLFNGTFSDTPLSFPIDSYWRSSTTGLFPFIKIANDVVNKQLYIIPFNSVALLMDYSNGLTPAAVKWSVWTFTATPTVTGVVFALGQDGTYKVLFNASAYSQVDYHLYGLDTTKTYDVSGSYPILQQVYTALLGAGGITTFTGLNFRAQKTNNTDNSTMNIVLKDIDGINASSAVHFILKNYVSQKLFKGINYTSEKMQVQLYSSDGGFSLQDIEILGQQRWAVRANITQST
jgi:hypothetical protein